MLVAQSLSNERMLEGEPPGWGPAVYSADQRHRFTLARKIMEPFPHLVKRAAFILLNPSTATDAVDGPTIMTCTRIAARNGITHFAVLNLFSFRSADPRWLKWAQKGALLEVGDAVSGYVLGAVSPVRGALSWLDHASMQVIDERGTIYYMRRDAHLDKRVRLPPVTVGTINGPARPLQEVSLLPPRKPRVEDVTGDQLPDGSTANLVWILEVAKRADLVVCAWGNHGAFLERGALVSSLLRREGVKLHRLSAPPRRRSVMTVDRRRVTTTDELDQLTKEGQPRHPLYMPNETSIVEWP